jgi:hypothetical protein
LYRTATWGFRQMCADALLSVQTETYVVATFVERGLPYTNTLTVQIPTVFIGLRPTGLPGTIKEFVMKVVSAQLGEGVHDVAKVEIARVISQAGGSISRSGLKLALAELIEGSTRFPPQLIRVSPARYALRARSSCGERQV